MNCYSQKLISSHLYRDTKTGKCYIKGYVYNDTDSPLESVKIRVESSGYVFKNGNLVPAIYDYKINTFIPKGYCDAVKIYVDFKPEKCSIIKD
jgi:hypothetical protein